MPSRHQTNAQHEFCCPFTGGKHAADDEPKIAGRFGIVEADIITLKKGQEHSDDFVSRGFDTVYSKIDAIAKEFKSQIAEVIRDRSQGVIPQITILLTIASIFAAAVYMYMSGQTAVISQQLATQSAVTTQQITAITTSISEIKVDFRATLAVVDQKLAAMQSRTDERTKAIDEKISLTAQLQQKAFDAAYANKDEIAAWRLQHIKENAYAQGRLDAGAEHARDDIKIIEERQHANTGKISELDWIRQPGMKDKLDGKKP